MKSMPGPLREFVLDEGSETGMACVWNRRVLCGMILWTDEYEERFRRLAPVVAPGVDGARSGGGVLEKLSGKD